MKTVEKFSREYQEEIRRLEEEYRTFGRGGDRHKNRDFDVEKIIHRKDVYGPALKRFQETYSRLREIILEKGKFTQEELWEAFSKNGADTDLGPGVYFKDALQDLVDKGYLRLEWGTYTLV